jgi:shikimate kinase
MRLYIIGMPGTGKTYFGRMLAKSLRMQFYDLDDAIEKQEGHIVREIIDKKGEDYFRLAERDTLIRLSQNGHCIVSCGGGAPIYHSNMEYMKSNGIVLWLNTNLEIIADRISKNISRRPLFIGLTRDEILIKLQEIFAKRKKIYVKADLIVDLKTENSFSLNTVIQGVMKLAKRRMK